MKEIKKGDVVQTTEGFFEIIEVREMAGGTNWVYAEMECDDNGNLVRTEETGTWVKGDLSKIIG